MNKNINRLKNSISVLEQILKQQREELCKQYDIFKKELEESGWQKFEFISIYYGSHDERGEGDIQETYFFHPDLDISKIKDLKDFKHGSFSRSDDCEIFEIFVAGLDDDKYFVFKKKD